MLLSVENWIGDNVGIFIGMVLELKNIWNLILKEVVKMSWKFIFFNLFIGN